MIEFFRNRGFSVELHPYLQEIDRFCRIKNTNEHTQIFSDEILDSVFFVCEGVIKSFYLNKDGKEFTDWFFSKGDIIFFPECLFYDLPSRITLQTLCPSVLLKLKKTDYFTFREKHPIFKEITKSLELDLLKRQQEHRENERFLSNDNNYRVFAEKYPYILARIQGKQLAAFLGVNSNTVSVMKRHFQENDKSRNNHTT